MSTSMSKGRRRKAFDDGRRAAAFEAAANPYSNTILRDLWERGRDMQKAGQLTSPVPQPPPPPKPAAPSRRPGRPSRPGSRPGGFGGGGPDRSRGYRPGGPGGSSGRGYRR